MVVDNLIDPSLMDKQLFDIPKKNAFQNLSVLNLNVTES